MSLRSRLQDRALGALWVCGLVAVLVTLWRMGHTMPAPPITEPHDLELWLDRVGPIDAVVACLRVLAIMMTAYLLAITALRVALVALDRNAPPTLERLTPRVVRKVVTTSAGASAATAAGLLSIAGTSAVDTASASAAVVASDPAVAVGPLVLGPLEHEQTPLVMAPLETTGLDAAASETEAASADEGVDQWEVEPCDSFWSIAEQVIAELYGPEAAADDGVVGPYWVHLVEVNRQRLADPTNPDLLFPGQLLEIPPVPALPGDGTPTVSD